MGKRSITDVFLREKPAKMLVEMKRRTKSETYASNLSKAVDCTYSHVVKILKRMHKAGLVEFKKQGRLKLLCLTKKGEKIAEYMDKTISVLEDL